MDDVTPRITDASAAAADEEYVRVPKFALDWLFGAGPDTDGRWFDETWQVHRPTGAFWWRSEFKRMITTQELKETSRIMLAAAIEKKTEPSP